eukprot:15458578-Alexandrium_andersonii.AAC.1
MGVCVDRPRDGLKLPDEVAQLCRDGRLGKGGLVTAAALPDWGPRYPDLGPADQAIHDRRGVVA